MKSQFFKIIPKPAGLIQQEPKFVWINNPDEKKLHWIQFTVSPQYINGVEDVVPAQKDDPDFKKYLRSDIEQVQKEIDKLEVLKARLINALED